MARNLLRRGAEYVSYTLAIAMLLCLAADAAPTGKQPAPLEPRDVETLTGTVARVQLLPRAGGGGRDLTLVLRTDIGDEVQVAVAPRRAVRAMGLRLRAGDRVQVAGWRIVRGKPAILAAEIGAGGRLFVFRDRHGYPLWRP